MSIPLPPPAERFYENTLYLLNYCEGLISDAYNKGLTNINPIDVRGGILWMKATYEPDPRALVEMFVIYSYPYWEPIRGRNEKFFDKEIFKVFNGWDREYVALFRDLFFIKTPEGALFIQPEQKKTIWDTFNSLVKICIQYIHDAREPYWITHGQVIGYRKPEEHSQIMNLTEMIQIWGLTSKVHQSLSKN